MRPEAIAVAVSVLLVGWYVTGYVYNLRRGRRLRQWLEGGLDAFGGEIEAGWIGTPASGARFNVRRAKPPFKRLEVTLLLANRETPLLWFIDHLRGKRDRCIIRGTLRSPRGGEVWVGSTRRTDRQGESWTCEQGPHGLAVCYRGRDGFQLGTAVNPFLEAYGAHLQRFHWRKQDPHVDLQLMIAGLLQTEAHAWLHALSTALLAHS